MNIALWIVQILLALAFLMAGFMKSTQPRENLAKNMGWVNDFTPMQIRIIGVLEVLAGIGLILPMLLMTRCQGTSPCRGWAGSPARAKPTSWPEMPPTMRATWP